MQLLPYRKDKHPESHVKAPHLRSLAAEKPFGRLLSPYHRHVCLLLRYVPHPAGLLRLPMLLLN